MKLVNVLIFLLVMHFFALGQEAKVYTLKECIELGLKNNPSLRMAQYQYKMSKNNVKQSLGSWLPTLSGSIGYTKSERGPSSFLGGEYIGPDNPFTSKTSKYDNYSQRINLSWNFLDFGTHYYSTKSSMAEAKAQEMSFFNTKQQTILNIIEKYFNVIQQQKILEVKKKSVERSEEQVRRAEAMYKVGSAAKIDVYRAKVNLGNDQMSYMMQKDEVVNAKQQLNLVLGMDPMKPIEIKADLRPILDIEGFDSLFSDFEKRNPVLQNLKFSALSTKYRKWASLGQMLPTVSLFAGYSRSVPDRSFWFKEFDREYSWFYGISLNINLFNGFRDKVNYENSVINYRMALENYRNQKLQNINQLNYLYNRFNTLKAVRKTNLLNLQAAQEEFNLAEERYRVGSGTSLEVRDAQVKLSQAEQLVIEADYNLLIVYYQIKSLLGELE